MKDQSRTHIFACGHIAIGRVVVGDDISQEFIDQTFKDQEQSDCPNCRNRTVESGQY